MRLLEYATDSSARVLGKPSPEFFTALLDALAGDRTPHHQGPGITYTPISLLHATLVATISRSGADAQARYLTGVSCPLLVFS